MVCPKGPNKAHKFEKHVCVYCNQDDMDFEREVVEKVLKFMIEKGHVSTGTISGMRREILEHRPIDKKLEKLIGNISHTNAGMDELIQFADELNTMITDHYCDGCDQIQDCDNCDERRGDPPDHSWRD